ncbi:hypothetical protein B0H94_11853 [Salsuginibacillus halophilus]|uniref:Uncharacterized protein n=1 Tax=Salsuginibacillus halophilus TaxID=517424 RepID=A0A2P8H6C0_9BACI|nr:hypothetical protein [Salsuginibacillus halophilus]PSL41740.1 hypothetical protein B0H94_11853 [Salsuginibacillus halophilus]
MSDVDLENGVPVEFVRREVLHIENVRKDFVHYARFRKHRGGDTTKCELCGIPFESDDCVSLVQVTGELNRYSCADCATKAIEFGAGAR